MKLKVLDLFAGIGGFSYGLESTGHFETVGFCEMDKFCQKVLAKNFPNIKIYEDVRSINGREIKADVVTGGFPCQGFSQAGKQRGTSDERYLWPEMFRVISEVKPRWVIGENVQGIINIENGMVLRQVHNDLESEGFEVQCFVIPASGKGAWHQRNRVWIIGYSEHNGSSSSKIKERNSETSTGSQKRENTPFQSERTSRSADNGNVSNTDSQLSIRKTDNGYEGCGETSSIKKTIVSNTDNVRFERDQQTTKTTFGRRTEATSQSSGENVSNTNSQLSNGCSSLSGNSETKQERLDSNEKEIRDTIRSKTKRCSEQIGDRDATHSKSKGLQGSSLQSKLETPSRQNITQSSSKEQHTWWQAECRLRELPHGISYDLDKNRVHRIKALGNSIVPQVVYEFGLAIIEAEK